MAREFSRELANEVEKCLKKTSLHYTFNADDGIFSLIFNVESELKRINIILMLYKSDMEIRCSLPVRGNPQDAAQMTRLSDYICRCSSMELLGSRFEMDFSDGELCYYRYIECLEGVPLPKELESYIRVSVDEIEKLSPGLLKLV